jgi:hypothetical protein
LLEPSGPMDGISPDGHHREYEDRVASDAIRFIVDALAQESRRLG